MCVWHIRYIQQKKSAGWRTEIVHFSLLPIHIAHNFRLEFSFFSGTNLSFAVWDIGTAVDEKTREGLKIIPIRERGKLRDLWKTRVFHTRWYSQVLTLGSIQFSLFCGHGIAPKLSSFLLMYAHEEGRRGKSRGKPNSNFEKQNKKQNSSKHKSVMSSLKREGNDLMHSKTVKTMGLPGNSLTKQISRD